MTHENNRKETPFDARDNILEIWKQITELCMRGFGLRRRKKAKAPNNFEKWSKKSQDKWIKSEELKRLQQEKWDSVFVDNETKVLEDICRNIVHMIDRGNSINPQYMCEYEELRMCQTQAIEYCFNLKRELNHIADTIPCNANFLAKQVDSIETEIRLLNGWRKYGNKICNDVIEKEINRRKTVASKIGFILGVEDLENLKQELVEIPEKE